MASKTRQVLLEQVGAAARANQTAVDALDEAAAAALGINRTDLRCIDILLQEPEGAAIPARLAERLGISTGSVTALLDRLERAGYLTRSADPRDRRKVTITPTKTLREHVAGIWGPIAEEGAQLLAGYSIDDLRVVLDFMERSRRLQDQHVTRIRALRLVPSLRTGRARS